MKLNKKIFKPTNKYKLPFNCNLHILNYILLILIIITYNIKKLQKNFKYFLYKTKLFYKNLKRKKEKLIFISFLKKSKELQCKNIFKQIYFTFYKSIYLFSFKNKKFPFETKIIITKTIYKCFYFQCLFFRC